jgi:hypothetical protein
LIYLCYSYIFSAHIAIYHHATWNLKKC